MRRFITTILFFTLLALMTCNAFETHFMSVDFEKMQLIYRDKVYELVEIRNRIKHHHREITYLCIDENCKSVVFRLFFIDGGEYMKLQKYNSKK